VTTDGGEPPGVLAERGCFRNLRDVGALLSARDASLMAYARAISYWHQGHRFCGSCGSPTVSAEAGHLRVCTSQLCGEQHFPRTDPAVIVRVASRDGSRCLMARKSFWPGRMHSVIAGFVEPGESLEMAVVREVAEETGIHARNIHYFSSQPWPFPRSLMLGFTAEATDEAIHLNDGELDAAGWFSREEILRGLRDGTFDVPTSVSISHRLIEAWFDTGDVGPLRDVKHS
jgi:NAD+ diphosphatase